MPRALKTSQYIRVYARLGIEPSPCHALSPAAP